MFGFSSQHGQLYPRYLISGAVEYEMPGAEKLISFQKRYENNKIDQIKAASTYSYGVIKDLERKNFLDAFLNR